MSKAPDPDKIFRIKNDADFEALTLEIFRFQADACTIYKEFILNLGIDIYQVNQLSEIPFLPISFFKSHKVIANGMSPELIFSSSGTTGQITSKHYVAEASLYERSFMECFRLFYGDPSEYCILGLLPGYLERKDSSLVYMMKILMEQSGNRNNGFYLYEHEALEKILLEQESKGLKSLLVGVSFGLLDFFENRKMNLKHTTIIETGGMKGRRKELIREELQTILKDASGIEHIHSEYGMTELLSQAWSTGEGEFLTPPWMKLMVREATDPFAFSPTGKTGGINVIDLANLYSCSFIATQDLGKILANGKTEILGRFDNSDIRGCSLMV